MFFIIITIWSPCQMVNNNCSGVIRLVRLFRHTLHRNGSPIPFFTLQHTLRAVFELLWKISTRKEVYTRNRRARYFFFFIEILQSTSLSSFSSSIFHWRLRFSYLRWIAAGKISVHKTEGNSHLYIPFISSSVYFTLGVSSISSTIFFLIPQLCVVVEL